MSENKAQFTLGQIVIISTFLISLSFFSFYLGARFGPELFWGIQLGSMTERGLLPEELLDREIQGLLLDGGDAKLTFHESLKSKKDEEKEKLSDKTDKIEVKEVKEVQVVKINKDIPTEKTVQPIKAETQVVPKKEEEIAKLIAQDNDLPASKPQIEKSLYTLQIGSYSSSKDASAMQAKLKTSGYNALIQVVTMPGKGKWYRVKAGNYSDQASAESDKTKIQNRFGVHPVIVGF